jgi:protein ImuB
MPSSLPLLFPAGKLARKTPVINGPVIGDQSILIWPHAARFFWRQARLYRLAPVESDVPERNVQRVSTLATPVDRGWRMVRGESNHLDGLRTRRIRRGDGPERVFGEWWVRDAEMEVVRDYYSVEDEEGNRFLVYRSGDGVDPETGSAK